MIPTLTPADFTGSLFDVSIQERFEAFDRANPGVWQAFERIARRLKANGVRRYGAKAIMEIVRYERATDTTLTEAEPFKVNNSYISRYARKLIAADPSFAGFFETREIKTQ